MSYEILIKFPAGNRQRELVHQVQEAHGVSERRGCVALGVGRSNIRYRSTKPDQAPLRMRICDLAKSRVRYGYYRIYILRPGKVGE